MEPQAQVVQVESSRSYNKIFFVGCCVWVILFFIFSVLAFVGVAKYASTHPSRSTKEASESASESVTKTNTKDTTAVDAIKPSTPTTAPTVNPAPAKPACTQLKIYEGEFKSNKCYVSQDYNDLTYYIGRFDDAAFSYNSASSTADFTCNGSDYSKNFFKKDCDKAKSEKSQAKKDMEKYRALINAIIARGR